MINQEIITLTIVYGEIDGAINDPDTYFNHTYSQKWFEDPFVKER